MKRILSFAIALIMLSCAFISCGNSTPAVTTVPADAPQSTEPPVATEPPVTTAYPDIPEDIDYEQYEFKIFVNVHSTAYSDFDLENAGYDVVNEAAFKRNTVVEDTLKVTISANFVSGSAFAGGPGESQMRKDYTAAEASYDLCSIGAWHGPNVAQNKYAMNLYEVPYIDLTQPWWDQRANSDLGIGGKMYFTTGDIGLKDNLATHCILFSKQVAEEANITDIYDLVLQRKWTWDKFEEYTRMVSEDLNGDDVMNYSDKFGLLCWNDAFQSSFGAARTGIGMVNDNGELELTLYSDRNSALADRICNLMFDKTVSLNHMNQRDMTSSQIITTMFPNGQALFLTTLFDNLVLLRDSDMDFGIIPLPMYDEAQGEYGGYVGPTYSSVWAIETYVEDLERTGIVTELLACESMKILTPAYYEYTLKGRDVRDSESVECLDIIFANRSYDPGILYAVGSYTGKLTEMMKSNVNTFQNIYKTAERAAGVQIKTINKKFIDTQN